MLDRQRNAQKAENHVWVQVVPKAGKERNFMVPKEVKGGVAIVKTPDSFGKFSSNSPTHVLGEDGEYPADWPPGKTKFVQTTVTKVIVYEGDAELLSNITGRPIISAQLLTNLIDGVATAAADAMRKSMEGSSEGKMRKPGGLMWVYIITMIGVAIGIVTMVMVIGHTKEFGEFVVAVKQSLGIPLTPVTPTPGVVK